MKGNRPHGIIEGDTDGDGDRDIGAQQAPPWDVGVALGVVKGDDVDATLGSGFNAGVAHQGSAVSCSPLDRARWQPTGGIDVKGKGRMETYLWAPPRAAGSSSGVPHMASLASTAQAQAAGALSSRHPQVGLGLDAGFMRASVEVSKRMLKTRQPAAMRSGPSNES